MGSSWHRVVWGGKTAIDNCCDPDADVLEWRPDVRQRIDYFRDEFDLTYAEAIGCLDILKQELLKEATEDDDHD